MIEMLLLLIIGPLDAIRGGLLATRFRFTVKAGVIGYGWRPSGHLWGHQEFVRGWIVAALLWVM